MSKLSDKSFRIKYRKFTKYVENKNGADWEWWLLTDEALLRFYVQAKKIDDKIKPSAILYKTRNTGPYQIDKLIQYSNEDNALPLYAFYSKNELETICKYANNRKCYKAIYLASAIELKNNINNLESHKLLNPMSCFFKTYQCLKEPDILCVCCLNCDNQDYCNSLNSLVDNNQCILKITKLLKDFYFKNLDENNTGFYEVLPEHIAIFQFANSVLKNEKLRDKFFKEFSYAINVNSIVITDYTDRHSKKHVEAIIGSNNIVLDNTILEKEQILCQLKEILKKYKIISSIGLFGSYAKNNASKNSDIDLMVIYNKKEIKKNGFKSILDFLKETIILFSKAIDFVDYEDCDERFKEEVEEDIIWINLV